jgi:hypothetical protein
MLMVKFPIGAAGHLAFRNRLALEYWHLALRTPAGGRADTVFYEGNLDMLLGNDGWVLSDDLDAMVMLPFRLNLGLRYSALVPLYREDQFLTSAEAQTYAGDNVNQRLGVIATYTFFDHGFTTFNKPTLIFMANWYLQSRFRTGADVSRAVPYLALAFAFQSDLLE